MNEKLHKAITAARSGQSIEAQLLLAQVLKEDPNETQAWFLLSSLVDSDQKKLTYLSKVLALDPEHEMAKQMLDRLQVETEEVEAEAVDVSESVEIQDTETELDPPTVSADPLDYLAQEKGDTVPDWLADEEGLPWEDIVPSSDDTESITKFTEAPELPDWLQEDVRETWEEAPEAEERVSAESIVPEPEKIEAVEQPDSSLDEDHEVEQTALTRVLSVLVVIAVIILLFLFYLIWTTLL